MVRMRPGAWLPAPGGAGLPSAFTPAAWCFGIFQKTGKDMDHGILFDHARTARIGLPEAVFCEGKPFEALVELLSRFGRGSGHPVLFTRLAPDVFARVHAEIRAGYDYHPLSRTAFGDALPPKGKGRVAVISAGTADGFVAWRRRVRWRIWASGTLFEDCGVAGLWRLAERLEEINTFDAVIVVAGLDAALVSVMGGLTPKPIFGVPTSVGYGAAQGGRAALASMLSSCAPGVGIMNIDNGYGAACAAARVVNGL